MLHGLAWKSKRLDTGTHQKDAAGRLGSSGAESSISRRSSKNKKREEISHERTTNHKVLEPPEFVVELIDDEEDNGIETELCTVHDVRKYNRVTNHTANKDDDYDVIVDSSPRRSLVHHAEQHKRTGDGTVNHHDHYIEEGRSKAYQNEARIENRDELSVTRLRDTRENHDAFYEEVASFEKGRGMATNVNEEQRDDIGADVENKEDEVLSVVSGEQDKSTFEVNSGSVMSSVKFADSTFYSDESTQAISTVDVGTTDSESGTSPIDFVHAIMTGEVWSDIFDDGKYSSRNTARSVSQQFPDNESVNPLVDAISDFIQGDESKRAYHDSHDAQLSTTLSRREQAKNMNASRARETREMMSLLSLVPKTATSTKKSKNQPKQRNTTTQTNRSETKSGGVVAYMTNCVGGQSNLEMITPHQVKEFRLNKTRLDGHHDTTQHQSNQRNSKSYFKRRRMPWIERPGSTKTSSTSSNRRTRQESIISGRKDNDEFQLDDVKKCCEEVAENWVDIGRVLLCMLNDDSSLGSYNRSRPSQGQRSKSKDRRSTGRSPSPRAKSRAAVMVGRATGASRRPTTTAAVVSPSPRRRNGPRQHRSLSPQPIIMTVPRPSSPVSVDRRKSPLPRGRSPPSSPRSSPVSTKGEQRHGPPKQRSKTMSPTRSTSKRTPAKVTIVNPHSSTPRGIAGAASPRSSSPLNTHEARGGGGIPWSTAGSTDSRSHSKRRITVRKIETKRKSQHHQQQQQQRRDYNRSRPLSR